MKLKKKLVINLSFLNLIRRFIIKFIIFLEKLINKKKANSVYDRRSILELLKHYLNVYTSYLKIRSNQNYKEYLENLSIYSINKKINNTLFLVDINKFSGYEGAYYFDEDSPLVKTAIQLLKYKDLKLEDSYLYHFNSKFQPKNFKELYNLSIKNQLCNLSSTTIFMPWLHKSPLSIFHAGVFGPKHISATRHRILRLKNIIRNINLYGYVPSEEDSIEGYIAILNNDYRFVITAGHHRVAVLKALNRLNPEIFNYVSVKFDLKRVNYKIVNNEEIYDWPGIKSGYINSVDSLELFEKYFIN